MEHNCLSLLVMFKEVGCGQYLVTNKLTVLMLAGFVVGVAAKYNSRKRSATRYFSPYKRPGGTVCSRMTLVLHFKKGHIINVVL